MPPKLTDPGSFSIPCTIGSLKINRALCDLGESINMMLYSIYKELVLQEPQPTNIIVHLADKSFIYLRGIMENLLVKVGKFFFLADFVILDIKEDEKVPIILGRPFLYIRGVLIDLRQGKCV